MPSRPRSSVAPPFRLVGSGQCYGSFSYYPHEARQLAQISLRRLGEKPRCYPGLTFAEDEERWMDQFGLTEREEDLVRRRDWIGLWQSGMSIYTMVKLIGVTGTPLVEIGKQMRASGGQGGDA